MDSVEDSTGPAPQGVMEGENINDELLDSAEGAIFTLIS